MSIGKNIKKYRKALGLTQEELGVKLGVTNQAVSKWESEVSMPDVMLLPEIVDALNISLEDIYGITRKHEKTSVSSDDFPTFCYKKLIELFYYNTKMRFTHIGSSDKEQLDFQFQKLMNGFKNGCISNTQGAFVISEDFSFIDCSYKAEGSEDIIKSQGPDDYTLMYLTDQNLRKVFYYLYKTSFEKDKVHNTEYTFDEIMNGCNLTESETANALRLLKDCNIIFTYTDIYKIKKYEFQISKAVYARAIYRLVDFLAEDNNCWLVVRDTSMLDDYAF